MRKTLSAVFHIIAAEALSKDISLRLIGWICRHVLHRRIDTAILFYPANKRYMESVTYAWFAERVRWSPCFGGVFLHKGSVGLIFAIGAFEQQFTEDENARNLISVHQRMTHIGKLCGATNVAYSGVLPGILTRIGIQREPIEIAWTARWVAEALQEIERRMDFASDVPVVIIGSAGFLGSQVVRIIKAKQPKRSLLEIDPLHPDPLCRDAKILDKIQGQKAILINISRRHVIDHYVGHLWRGLAVLNEVYPECSDEVLAQLKSKGIRYFHLQGVRAWSLPRFPGAYAGAIPCCAASASEYVAESKGNIDLLVMEK